MTIIELERISSIVICK